MTDINTYLTSLAEKLVLDDPLKEKIETSIGHLRSKIWGLFQEKLLNITVFGSYDRGTIIPIGADIDVDILVVFKQNELQPDTYLKHIRDFCEKNYPKSEIYQDHPTIVIELNHIKFEIAPSFSHSNGSVKIPASRSEKVSWISTSPADFKSKLLAKDKGNKGLIIPLVKLFKYWNNLNGKPFTSYELERFIIGKEYFSSTLREYYFAVSTGLDSLANTEKQKAAVAKLKECNRRIKGLEQIKVFEYIENELQTFLPPI